MTRSDTPRIGHGLLGIFAGGRVTVCDPGAIDHAAGGSNAGQVISLRVRRPGSEHVVSVALSKLEVKALRDVLGGWLGDV